MKKRLLSAALAFAMVLAMIPATMVPAFAVEYATPGSDNPSATYWTDSRGNSIPFYGPNANGVLQTVRVEYQESSDNTTKREGGKWYWLNDKVDPRKYNEISTGIVVGTGKSGNWYPSIDAYLSTSKTGKLPGTSFTLLDNQTLPSFADAKDAPTTLTVDVNGNTLDLGGDLGAALPPNFSRLTITNSRNPQTYRGGISALSRDITNRVQGTTYSNLTVVLSNISVPSIDFRGGTNSVTLNNVEVTGGITLNGTTVSTNGTTSYSAQTLNVNMSENETRLSTTTTIGGNISITGDNSKVVLNNVQAGSNSLTMTSNGGSINVDGLSAMGDIELNSRNGDNAALPSVVIDGGSVGTIERTGNESKQANKVTINSAGTAANVETPNGDVTMNQGKVTTLLKVDAGKVTLNGPVVIGPANSTGTDGLVVGGRDKVTLSIKGTGSDISGITATNGANLTIASGGWPAGRENNFGVLDLGTYKGRGVTGGTFTNGDVLKDSNNALWFSKDLQLVVDMGTPNWALYGNTEMARAISDRNSTNVGGISGGLTTTTALMYLLGQGDSTGGGTPTYKYTLDLINGGITWATVAYSQPTGMILPERINGYDIATWVSGDSNGSVVSGKESIIPKPYDTTTNNFKLYANDVATTIVKSITNVAVAANPISSSAVNNQNVRVSMSGTQITISGAIVAPAGSSIATIELDLTTDALANVAEDGVGDNTTAGGGSTGNAEGDAGNDPGVVGGYKVLKNVEVFYNVDTKAIGFTPLQKIDGGAIVNEAGELVLNNGTGTHYTVKASLVESAPSLGIGPEEIHATVSGNLSKRSQTDKDRIIEWLAGTENGGTASFDINGNRAVLEAINAAQATITSDKTVENWVTTARNYVWRNGNSYKDAKGQDNGKGKGRDNWTGVNGYINSHTGNYSTTGEFQADAVEIASRYAAAYIVPYLMINATDMNENGTLKATLSVYYRVDVSKAGGYDANEYYTVQPGRALSALTGDMATFPLKVTFNSAGAPFDSATQMHQDGKYVYTKNYYPNGAAGGNYGGFAINHAGPSGNGLGTIELNTTPGPITLTSSIVNRAPSLAWGVNTYDDLQAAIDDTVPGIINNTLVGTETLDTITIGGTYKETNCSITMSGVARKIAVNSNGDRKITSNTSGVSVQTNNGYNYIIQLTKDNVATGTVALTVQGTENGTATLSSKTAKVGEKVTVTLQPVNGRMPTGVSIKTNTGTEIKATATDNPNEYTFTVPNGATSITVTPTYKASGSTPTTTTEATIKVQSSSEGTAIANADKAKPGATVTVAVQPEAGYRTMGLVVSPNSGNATAVRQNTNSFTFTVPSNATAVTVTPSFDKDNGTVFTDVWSTDYYSNPVAWAVKEGITNGQSTYLFGSGNSCTRAEMVTFLYRAAGSPTVTGVSNPFVDVNPSEYYYNAVLWAVSKGITDGVDRTHFGPKQTVTRGQAVTFLYRYENSPAASSNNAFVDVSADAYYAKAVSWAASKGVTNGSSTTTFSPNVACKRCEIVTFMYRDMV